MTTFKQNDIVRIIRQPSPQMAGILGIVGFIEHVSDAGGHVSIHGLDTDGSSAGFGWVPVDCVEPEPSPVWVQAHRLYEARLDNLMAAMKKSEQIYLAKIRKLAKEYKLKPKAVMDIHKKVEEFRNHGRE